MNRYNKIILTFLATVFFSLHFYAQSLPDSILKKIDNLFSEWNTPNSPGCAVGMVRNDSLIFAKGYGMANLEYSLPNDRNTLFHMASVSKQFYHWEIAVSSAFWFVPG